MSDPTPNFVRVTAEQVRFDGGASEEPPKAILSLIPSFFGKNAKLLAEYALLLPEEEARANRAVILYRDENGTFLLGMMNASDFPSLKNVARILKVETSRIEPRALSALEFDICLTVAYTGEVAALVRREVNESKEAREGARRSVSWRTDINPESANAPTTDYSLEQEESRGFRATIEEILREGSRRGASDVHFKPGPIHGSIWFRIDGYMYEYAPDVPRSDYERLTRGLTDMAGGTDYNLRNQVLDSTITQILPVPGKGNVKRRLRFSGVKTLDGLDISVRYLSNEFYDFHEMGHEPEQLEVFFRSLKYKNGVILVTGATGSGKSTLLEAKTRRLQSIGLPNIIVIADPIEFEDARRTQIEVDEERGLTFPIALKSSLRKDPNIIVVGEIRDEETAEIAFRAANTGHLVLTTLHTNDVASTFARLTNLGIKQYNQAGLIRCICSQALVRRLCNKCKEQDPKSPVIAASIIEQVFPHRTDLISALQLTAEGPSFYQASTTGGCAFCHNTGYKGRVAISEVLENTPDIGNMLCLGMTGEQAVEFSIKEYGMLSQAETAARKLASGVTSFSEVESWLTPPPPKKERFHSDTYWSGSSERSPNGNGAAQASAQPETTYETENVPGGGPEEDEAVDAEYVEVHA